MLTSNRKPLPRDAAWVIFVSLCALLLTEIPYKACRDAAPAGSVFIGQIAVAEDINSYYSFMRQAALGHIVFSNTMTYIDHRPVFVNVEFLVLGKLMGWFGWSPQTVFEVWRVAGVFALIAGFATLAHVALHSEFQRRVALVLCAFGGGFGWLLTIFARMGLLSIRPGLDLQNPALDLNSGIQPFLQMARNPHFSLPHGTFLLAFACMVLAERTRRAKWYGIAGIIAVLHGLMRPYDLISLFTILPVFILLECAWARRVEWRWNMVRSAPLVLTAPLLLYYAYLFSVHPVFKYWASQGGHPAPIPVHWHLVSLGLALVLFIGRVLRARSQPIATPDERLVLVWGASLIVLFHSYRFVPFMPYTPQLAVPSVTPLIVIGVTLLPTLKGMAAHQRRYWLAMGVLLVSANALSTPVYLRQESRRAPADPLHYIRTADIDAVAWLNNHTRETDVVLAKYPYGTRISQYLNARVAVGHWALSPHVAQLNPRIDAVIDGNATPGEASALLDEIRPRYIYVTREGPAPPPVFFQNTNDWSKVFENDGVTLYERKGTTSPPA